MPGSGASPPSKITGAALTLLAAFLLSIPAFAKGKVERFTFTWSGQPRTYFCLIPSAVADPLPVVVLLHGSGNNGQQMTGAWSDLASRERFIIVAPNSLHSETWDSDSDGPAFLHAVVAEVAARHPIDPHRVYLFGHSGGAVYALGIALIDSEYFAAAGGHAGALTPENAALFNYAHRKMPIALWVGAQDDRVSVDSVNATRDAFAAHGFSVRVTVIPFAGHAYDGQIADKVDRAAWDFFRPVQLP
jgi:poly(3-hydroxybutyrate) depolymerase